MKRNKDMKSDTLGKKRDIMMAIEKQEKEKELPESRQYKCTPTALSETQRKGTKRIKNGGGNSV